MRGSRKRNAVDCLPVSSFRTAFVRLTGALVLGICLVVSGVMHADETDEVLKLKTRNRDKVKSFSAEYVVHTKQPKSVKNPKTLKLRYKMKLEKIPKEQRKSEHNPWKMETEVIEPLPMIMKVEGDNAWFQDQNGKWIPLEMTPELKEQFLGMSERFLGADAEQQKKNFGIKVVRRNNPIFGPRTCYKVEEVYRNEYRTREEAWTGWNRWREWYINERLHSRLGYRAPVECELQLAQVTA